MKRKKEFIILIIIIIGLSSYLYMRKTDKTHYELPEVPEVKGKDITKIEITKSNTTIVLNKKEGKWVITPPGYPADEKKIKNMVDIFEKIKLTALVSESKNYNRYDLGTGEKINTRAWIGETLIRDFDIGKTSSSSRHTFVRLADDKRVFHAREKFRNKFDQSLEKLRDKIVLSFEKDKIQEIKIDKDNKSFELVKKEIPVEIKVGGNADINNETESPPVPGKIMTTWVTTDGKKAIESEVNNLLSILSSLSCEKYIVDRKKGDFKDPLYTVRLKGIQEYTLSVFDKKDKGADEYPAISSENDYPFLLPKWRVDKIVKDPAEMIEKVDKP